MAGSITDNAAIYKKKPFAYVPPSTPAALIDSTSYTLDFTTRKFLLVGIDPTDNFQTVIHILTSSRHVKLSTDFLKRIFSLMGNVLSFILDIPTSYKRNLFLEIDLFKLSSMVYVGSNNLVIESKTEDGCRVLLNRSDLIQLQNLEWSIAASIREKDIFIKPKIIKQMNEYSENLIGKILQVDSPPNNVREMQIFINNQEVKQTSENQFLNQIKMFAPTQLTELCMNRLVTPNTPEPYDKNFRSPSLMIPSYSPVNAGNYKSYEDPIRSNGFNLTDEDYDLSKPIDHFDGPTSPDDSCSQQLSFDENDGPDFFNLNHASSQFKTPRTSRSTSAEPQTPLRKVKRRLF
ncbi:uncharacterized protein LOC132951349 [Metopolophium dirhodum]|uniref:uncharacterized protein LOC132951349 n=1 Tax=Metopolophium dirhodum TaxID=44670 RepID=UPI00299033ED|nr:uncharacterized protein LOC132951349 [Metopolophium dirhodum]